MRTINKKDLQAEFQFFNTEIYNSKPIYITSEKYFEGGVYIGAPFKEKIEFYLLANKMSGILKELFAKEKIYIADFLCENSTMYFKWKDSKNHEIFRVMNNLYKKGKCYELTVAEDADTIDLIIESNFRYFSNISFFFPKYNLIIQPTMHTEILVYSFTETEKIFSSLKQISSKYPEIEVKLIN